MRTWTSRAKEQRISGLMCDVPMNAIRHINGHRVQRCPDGFAVDGVHGFGFDAALARIMPTVNEPVPFVRDQFGNQDV